MAGIKPKGNRVTGTAKNDKITFVAGKAWNKALIVNAGNGNDVINFKKSRYKNKLNGQNGNDTIYGGTNADTINGGNGSDRLYGYNGNDIIYGGLGNDQIFGGNGNDRIYGQYGTNTIKGENGNDIITGGTGVDRIWGGNGNDTVYGGAGNDVIYGDAGDDLLMGNDGNDTITGGAGSDTIYGGTGDDVIYGTAGLNTIYGEDGNDTIVGGYDNEIIDGGEGDDIIYGTAGTNDIYGGAGNDTIIAGAGLDTIHAGAGNDIIFANNSQFVDVYGEDGDDVIYGGPGAYNFLQGGDGNDTIYSGGADTTIMNGGDGDDEIYVGSGYDIVYGSAGTNNIYIDQNCGSNTLISGEGDDIINFSSDVNLSAMTVAIDENDLLLSSSGSTIRLKNYVINSAHSVHSIYKDGDAYSILMDRNGDATLNVGDENAIVIATREGSDQTINGGAGDQIFYTTSGANSIVYTGAGNNIINGSAKINSYHLQGTTNTLYMGGRTNNGSWGKTVYMGAGNDTIYMSSGEQTVMDADLYYITDTLNGGHDTFYWGGSAASIQGEMMDFTGINYDDIVFTRVQGSDDLIVRYSMNDDVTYKNYFTAGNEQFGGTMALWATGSGGWKPFTTAITQKGVQYAIEGLTGGDGDDYIVGTAGNDEITSGNGNNVIRTGDGADTIILGSGNDVVLAGDGKKVVWANNGGNNTIRLGYGISSEVILGQGSDTVYTGGGSVRIVFDEADTLSDTIIYEGDGTDSKTFAINGSSLATLSADVRDQNNIILQRGDGKNIYLKNYYDTTRKNGLKLYIDNYAGSAKTYYDLFDLDTTIGSASATTAQTITTSNGDDTVYLGQGSDTVRVGSMRTDRNTIYLSDLATAGNNDVYYWEGGNDYIILPASITDYVGISLQKNGDDLVVAYSNGDVAKNTFTIKDYYAETSPLISTFIKFKAGEFAAVTIADLIASKGVTETVTGTNNGEELGNALSPANQYILGLGGDDTISGGSGNDYINGGAGADTMLGGAGNDTYVIGRTGEVSDWGDGQDVINDTAGTDILTIDTTTDNIHMYFDVALNKDGLGQVIMDGVNATFNKGPDLYLNSTGAYTYDHRKDTSGVKIVNYFSGGGAIESIKLADASTDAVNYNLMNATAQAVANWLKANSFDSTDDAFNNGDAEHRAALLHLYKPIYSSETDYNATAGDDIIIGTKTGGNQDIYAGAGNDVIFASPNSVSYLYAGTGNDVIYGTNYYGTFHLEQSLSTDTNIIYMGQRSKAYSFGKSVDMGAGTDIIYMSTGEQNGYSNGDHYSITSQNHEYGGHDTFYWGGSVIDSQREMIVFGYTNYSDISYTRDGESNDLVIRYGEDNTVTFKDYFTQVNFGKALSLNCVGGPYTWNDFEVETATKVKSFIQNTGVISGTVANEYLQGAADDNTITTNGGNDTVNALAGNDHINITEAGNVVVYAGAGNDEIHIYGSGSAIIYGGTGSDEIVAETGSTAEVTVYTNGLFGIDSNKDTTVSNHELVDLSKLTGHNVIYAQSADNEIIGGSGNDDYYAYIDQMTSIEDALGTDKLTIMNTIYDGDELTDGYHDNLNIIFNYQFIEDSSDPEHVIPVGLRQGTFMVLSDNDLDNLVQYGINDPLHPINGISIDGAIGNVETITAGDGYYLTTDELNDILSAVAGWTNTGGYSDLLDVLEHGTESDISTLLACYTADWKNPNVA